MNEFIFEQVVKTIITITMFLFFIATIQGVNNRSRYEKNNNADSDSNNNL